MPAGTITSFAKQCGVSEKTVEKYWDEAKAAAGKTYDEKTQSNAFFGTVTNIVKRKLNKHHGCNVGSDAGPSESIKEMFEKLLEREVI